MDSSSQPARQLVICEAHHDWSTAHPLADDCKYPHNADVPPGAQPIIGHPYTPHD